MSTNSSPAAAPTDPNADQAEIAAVPARMVAAWAAHDADAFADLFTEDGTLILPGVYKKSRDEIREFMASQYAGPYQGTRVTGTPIGLKPLAAGAVALLTTGGVIAPGRPNWRTGTRSGRPGSWSSATAGGSWRSTRTVRATELIDRPTGDRCSPERRSPVA